ncbi:hypothetical protein [Carboxylicivirga caseinilyticus]|uniref:hypothetical protein n=1 Tax=Carboxylicivirga caseinilyticus TaxID=3417572 RepID=UPI003D348E8A|nr:hypothetical protein [Marinilabiliaceae bacterium A049]
MMISQTEIEESIIAQWETCKMKLLAQDWCESVEIVDILWQMNRLDDKKIAWRSAYLLDLIHDVNPSIIKPYLKDISSLVITEKNQSIKRHYLRILSQYDLSKIADGHLVDVCFKWLAIEDTPIAVKAHCMTILYNLCDTYPDLIPELKLALEGILPYGSKGEINRAKNILMKLQKE